MVRSEEGDTYLQVLRDKQYPFIQNILGLEIKVVDTVYPAGRISQWVAERLEELDYIKKGDKVLDYGCGCGFECIIAARMGAQVLGIDINPKAVEVTRTNSIVNGYGDSVKARVGDAFDAVRVGERFDVIIASLPWEDGEVKDNFDRVFYDEGFSFRKALFGRAKEYLTEGGRIIFTYAERVQCVAPIESFCGDDYEVRNLVSGSVHDEEHYIFEITPK